MSSPVAAALHVELRHDAIDASTVLSAVQHGSVGAVALFVGTVRDTNDGRAVAGIDYEAYEPMAEQEMRSIAAELVAEWPALRIAIVHRLGTLMVGDASVAIACAHARRAPAADAMRRAIEQLKVRVPIWKREHYTSGAWMWVDPSGNPR